VLASAALFAILMIVLALRMWAGRDPALGVQARAAGASQPALVRRIERRVVVTEVRHRAGAAATATPAASPAPAPPPAPAPVVTRSS
jgi:hypothetical protein